MARHAPSPNHCEFAANEETRVEFAKAKDAPEKLEVTPPFQLQLWHSVGPKKAKNAEGFVETDVDLRVRSPRDFC